MKKFFKFGCLGIIALIVLIIIIAVASGGGDDDKATTDNKETKTTESTGSDSKEESKSDEGVLTEEKFDKIKDGMSYEEVVKIIGSEGTVMSETGEKGTDLHTVMYEFETDGAFSSSTMMFQGDKLVNKSQVGLGGGSDVEITLDQFNKISNGMSLDEVIEIVGGEGEIISETGEKGTDLYTVMYSYTGDKAFSSVTLMFQGDKLQNKSQAGLE